MGPLKGQQGVISAKNFIFHSISQVINRAKREWEDPGKIARPQRAMFGHVAPTKKSGEVL